MSHRSWKFRIEDIIEALDRIFRYVQDLNYDGWIKDQKTIDAVIRNLEIIGEAAANVPQEIQDLYVDIPWYQMKGMRNIRAWFYLRPLSAKQLILRVSVVVLDNLHDPTDIQKGRSV